MFSNSWVSRVAMRDIPAEELQGMELFLTLSVHKYNGSAKYCARHLTAVSHLLWLHLELLHHYDTLTLETLLLLYLFYISGDGYTRYITATTYCI